MDRGVDRTPGQLSALAAAAASWRAVPRAPLELPPMRATAHAAATLFGPWPKARWYRYSRAAIVARALDDAGY
jgi:hypothetical protein